VKPELWDRVSDYLGRAISPGQRATLDLYRDWLEDEAIPGGGLGPEESDRLEHRHIADSLLFYSGWGDRQPPDAIWDLGSGVGLPGIPLAVLLPESEVLLVDRSGRRVDMAKRAVRVLGLHNVTVSQGDIHDLQGEAPMLVARAVTSLAELGPVIERHLQSGGRAVVGGSWMSPSRHLPAGWKVKEIPRHLLDRPVWLLIMRG